MRPSTSWRLVAGRLGLGLAVVLLTLGQHLLLQPRGPLLPVYGLLGLLALALLLSPPPGGAGSGWRLVLDLVVLAGMAGCMACVAALALLLPDQAFVWWRALLAAGAARGSISLAFQLVFLVAALAALQLLVRSGPGLALQFLTVAQLALWGLALGQPLLAAAAGLVVLYRLLVRLGRLGGGPRGLRARLGRLALLALVPVLLGLWGMAGPRGNRLVGSLVQAGIRQWLVDCFPGLPAGLALPASGMGSESARIDQVPVLSSGTVLTLRGSPGSFWYLKVHEFDRLADGVWTASPDSAGPGSQPARLGAVPAWFRPGLSLEIKADFFPGVVRTGNRDAVLVRDPGQAGQPGWQLFTDPGRLQPVPVWSAGTLMHLMPASLADLAPLEPAVRAACLAIPPEYTQTIRTFRRLVFGAAEPGEPRDYLQGIQRHLRDRYRYSLKPASHGTGAVFFRDFLESSRTGWCSHFATAMVLAARQKGLPARFVQGYTAGLGLRQDSVDIPGTAAHAWAEVWLDGSGWLRVEATPPWLADHGLFTLETAGLPDLPAAPEPTAAPAVPATDTGAAKPWALPLAAGWGLLAAGAGLGLWALWRRRSPAARWNLALAALDRRCRQAGLPRLARLCPGEWARACSRRYPNRQALLGRFARQASRVAWASGCPAPADIALVWRVVRALGREPGPRPGRPGSSGTHSPAAGKTL